MNMQQIQLVLHSASRNLACSLPEVQSEDDDSLTSAFTVH